MSKIILRMISFFGISGIGWLIDFTVFNLLTIRFSLLAINNMISSFFGASFVFIGSTRKIFIQKENGINLKYKFAIYISYQIVIILLMSLLLKYFNIGILSIFSEGIIAKFSAVISKIAITPITMMLNFCVMKMLIEEI